MTDNPVATAVSIDGRHVNEDGYLANIMAQLGDETAQGSAYVSVSKGGKVQNLNIRIPARGLSEATIAALTGSIPMLRLNGTQWTLSYADGVTHESTGQFKQGKQLGGAVEVRHVSDTEGELLANVRSVLPIPARGRLSSEHQAVCDKFSIDAGTLRGLARSLG